MKPETIKNLSFKNYLTKTFGSRIDKVLRVDDRGVELLISQIPIVNQTNTTAYDKCSLCSGSLYRQDIPFWTGSHKNKKVVVISQDAGKKKEDDKLNCVFSLQVAYRDKDAYVLSHRIGLILHT